MQEGKICEILERQKKIYLERGMAQSKVNLIDNIKKDLLKKLRNMEFGPDEIPFILVPSSKIISIEDLMNMVSGQYREKRVVGVEVSKIFDYTEESNSPWCVIYGVKIEKDFLRESPERVMCALKKERILNTIREVVVICIHTEVPKNYLCALNSYYGNTSKVLLIRYHSNFLQLYWNYSSVHGDWFFTSCAYRY